jgi:hypothetical protein
MRFWDREHAHHTVKTIGETLSIDYSARTTRELRERRTWAETMGRLSLRLLLAALLGARSHFAAQTNTRAQTQSLRFANTDTARDRRGALMIIVGDNAARAFGIFAAVSLVRFRTNIRDPKEITVLLISWRWDCVGRWSLGPGAVLAFFSLIVLWLLEWREPEQVFRSMELKVTTTNVVSTQARCETCSRRTVSIRNCERSIARRRRIRREALLFS